MVIWGGGGREGVWKERQAGAFYKNTLNHSALALSIVNNTKLLIHNSCAKQ